MKGKGNSNLIKLAILFLAIFHNIIKADGYKARIFSAILTEKLYACKSMYKEIKIPKHLESKRNTYKSNQIKSRFKITIYIEIKNEYLDFEIQRRI